MKPLLLVAGGGALGAILRHLLSGAVASLAGTMSFPLATFTVNVSGCALAGVVFGLSERLVSLDESWRLLMLTGLLGGFTTFSTFSLETSGLLRRGDLGTAAIYALGSVAAGVAAFWAGAALTTPITPPAE